MNIFKIFKKQNLEATKYDAAQTTRENVRHWSASDQLSADSSLTPEIRRTLRNRSRYETSNNAYAKGVVLSLANDTIGSGPRPQIITSDTQFNHNIEREFMTWASEIGLPEKLRTMRMAKIIDGEAFAIIVNNPRLQHRVKMDIRVIESDRVTYPLDYYRDNPIVDGIEFDEHDNPVRYHVLKYHPGDNRGNYDDYDTVTYENMIHWYRQDRPEQHRGLPELTPALPLFAQLRRYTLAVLASAETAADFAAVIYTDAPAGGEATPATPFDIVSLEKRMATTLPDGWKLGQLKAEQPTTNYPQFKREILGEIGRALQMPVNVVTGDSSQHNYASGRLDHQTYHRAIQIEQNHCSAVVMQKIFATWYREYRLTRDTNITLNASRYFEIDDFIVNWFWDGFEHVDPAKEANAQTKRLSNMTTSLAAEYARRGKDWEEEIRQISRERNLMTELGLIVEDVTDSGDYDPDNNNSDEWNKE